MAGGAGGDYCSASECPIGIFVVYTTVVVVMWMAVMWMAVDMVSARGGRVVTGIADWILADRLAVRSVWPLGVYRLN